jgi:hypothetical protein
VLCKLAAVGLSDEDGTSGACTNKIGY